MSEPRRYDPLALAVIGTAALLVVVGVAYLAISLRSDPSAQLAVDFGQMSSQISDQIRDQVRAGVDKLAERAQPAPPKSAPQKPAPRPQAKASPAPASPPAPKAVPSTGKPSAIPLALPDAGRWWRYNVKVEPEFWREATLTYRAVEQGRALAVHTDFRHATGEMKFNLGVFARGHPSHANTRFPGFFMHAAYLDRPLEVGQRFRWEWAWQLPDGSLREGRIKRYDGEVKAWESVFTPAGSYPAARIETILAYLEQGRAVASARETLWYSPQAMQVVKVVREGRTPDEGFDRIVAELAEFR